MDNSADESPTTNLTDRIGRDGAVLSVTEIGLGSLLHSLHIPLSGHFLSLNQAFILSRATLAVRKLRGARFTGSYISNIAALLKSLAPAGKKLTPMLAISAQGLLFTIGATIFGANAIGVLVGAVLLSVWAFVQPLLIYFLIFGRTLIDVANYYIDKLQEILPVTTENLITILATLISLKALLALAVAALAIWLPPATADRYVKTLVGWSNRRRPQFFDSAQPKQSKWTAARFAAHDLLNPLFLISIGLTLFFFIFSESDASTTFWGIMRPVAAAFVLFYLIRTVNFDTLVSRLDQTSFKGLGRSMAKAIEILKGI